MPRAKAAALRALELDDTLAEAHQSLAAIRWWGDWDGPGAERAFKRAVELNPNFAMARTYYAEFLTQQGRFDEALAEAHRAQQLDPLSPHTGDVLNNVYYFARQYDRAIEECRKAIVLNPGYARAHRTLGRAYRQKAMYLEAAAELSQALALNRHDQYLSELAHVYAVSGRRGEALKIINELEGLSARRQVSPVYIAKIYAALGEKDRALDWLRRGYAGALRPPGLVACRSGIRQLALGPAIRRSLAARRPRAISRKEPPKNRPLPTFAPPTRGLASLVAKPNGHNNNPGGRLPLTFLLTYQKMRSSKASRGDAVAE